MRALITGANNGIGFAVLNYFLNRDYSALAIDKAVNRLELLKKVYSKLSFQQIDLSENDKIMHCLHEINQPFDVMVYAAGVREIRPMVDLHLSEWQQVINVNLTGAFVLAQYASQLAIRYHHPLSLILISSISGLYGEPERSAYCASKHGLVGLTKSLSIELAQYAIRVNAIAPGIIETDLTRPYQNNPKIMEQLKCNIPLTRWGQPHHIVQAVDFIIKNDYITGSTLVVDGGWTAGKKV